MGKGDRKTRRGKIFLGSFGVSRPRKKRTSYVTSPNRLPKLRVVDSSVKTNVPASRVAWFEPKAYIHFGRKLTKLDEDWIAKKVSDSNWISRYQFFPMIHRTVIQRKFKKRKNGMRSHLDDKGKSTAKPRHLFYANHLDSAIYSYYAKSIIGERYEAVLNNNPELSDCVSAYRHIPVGFGNKKGKSNIHFAKEVFDYIKSQDDCIALGFDISGFFDNLDHSLLKKAWADLLGYNNAYLPPDHFNIFKSLTNFSFVDEIELLKLHKLQGLKDQNKLHPKLEKLGSYCLGVGNKQRNKYFRVNIASKLLYSHKKYEDCIVMGKHKGIPQGTAISALLANLYLLEFDIAVLEKAKSIGGYYRRYSDDIMVICSPEFEKEIEDFVVELIASSKFLLNINADKTEKSYFRRTGENSYQHASCPIKYLGFEFDGQHIRLKSAALAKYFRRAKSFVKRKVKKTRQMILRVKKEHKVWDDAIWQKYSTKGGRNFLRYVQRSATIIKEHRIIEQLKRHRIIIHKYVKKQKIKRLPKLP